MANRYWVGGTNSWSATNTTSWSATSGGTGGATVPTASDSVFFDNLSSASAYTVTITAAANCLDFNMVGPASGNVTWAGTLGLSIYGNMTVATTGITRSYSGAITFAGTSTTLIINCGQSLASAINFTGTGKWTLGSAFITNGIVTQTAGTFDTSSTGNYAFTFANFLFTGATTRAYYWNASTVTMTGQATFTISGSNYTANAGTSTLIISSNNNIGFSPNGATFYNISYTTTALNNSTILGSFTCNNLTYGARSSSGAGWVTISNGVTVTINGTFSNVPLNASCRLFFKSASIGTTVNIIAANVSLTDCDFRDVIASGTATWSGTRLGDCGGNTGITFATAKTVYFSLASGGNYTGTCWATTSGGTPGVNNFPLPQDTGIINNASSNASTTINLNQITNGYNVAAIDSTTRTTALTISYSSGTSSYYGGQTHSSSVTITGTNYIRFSGRGTYTATFPNGILGGIIVDNVTGTLVLGSNITYGLTYNLDHTSGNLDLNGYTLTAASYLNSGSLSRTLIGPGTIKLIGVTGNVWSSNANLVYTNNSTINVLFTGAIASGATLTVAHQGASTAAAINFAFQGGVSGSNITLRSTGYYRDLNFTGTLSTITNVACFVSGSVNMGTTATFTAGVNAWTFNGTSGTQTITTNTKTVDFPITINGVGGTVQQADVFTMGATRTFSLLGGTWDDGGYNSVLPTVSITGNLVRSMITNGTISDSLSWTASGTNATFSGTGTVSMTNSSAKIFAGGGFVYGFTLNQGGAGILTITGNNTFGDLKATVFPSTILFTGGSTTIFTNFALDGISGGLVTVGSTNTTRAIFYARDTYIDSDYLSISYINATGSALWVADASINGGNNIGWIFGQRPTNFFFNF